MSFEDLIMEMVASKSIKISFSLLVSFLAHSVVPIAGFIVTGSILVVADLVTGIIAAQKKKEPIHSNGLRRTVTKIVSYMAAVLLGHIVQQVYLPSVPIVYAISLYIALIEFKSNLENLSIITGTDIGKAVWGMIQSKLPKIK